MNTRAGRRQSDFTVWRIPVVLGLSTTLGLIAALLADGLGDVISWLTLGAPTLVAIVYALRHG